MIFRSLLLEYKISNNIIFKNAYANLLKLKLQMNFITILQSTN